MKTQQVWCVIKNDRVYNNSLFDSKQDVEDWVEALKKCGRYFDFEFKGMEIKEFTISNPAEDYGGPLGDWIYNKEENTISFARSTWQGD